MLVIVSDRSFVWGGSVWVRSSGMRRKDGPVSLLRTVVFPVVPLEPDVYMVESVMTFSIRIFSIMEFHRVRKSLFHISNEP